MEVLSDDPLAAVDVAHMCKEEGYEVVEINRQVCVTQFVLRRPG